MAGFLSLPREIRDMIYEICLVVNGEIVPYPAEYEYPRYKPEHLTEQRRNYMDRKPDVALLQVNKEIREETCPILYGRNLWRMSGGTLSHWDCRVRTFARFDRVLRHFKHVISSSDSRDLDHGYFDARRQLRHHKFMSPDEIESTEERMVPLHELRNYDLLQCWSVKMRLPYSTDIDLETVTIDISNSWCAFGCCRLFGDVRPRWYWKAESRLIIRGIINKKEARSIQDVFQHKHHHHYEYMHPSLRLRKLTILIEEENGSYTLMDDKKDLAARAREIQENYKLDDEASN
ncbi:hypothetical protein XPA_000125 [Xanthoria parietina]